MTTDERILIIKACGMLEDVLEQLGEAHNLSSEKFVQEILVEQVEMLNEIKGMLLVEEKQ